MTLISYLLYSALEIISYLILIRVILSFIPMQSNKFTEFVVMATEPCLGPIRMLLDKFAPGSMMLDFSPMIALIIIRVLQQLL